ncbi:folylpolyglutamate synthase [Nannizzia gypsea CBS 118893]|uniref:Folylpolyglutamate synthase n=1 Tax=Arthroderma gypseum (strain ATCC MYA-4604 / CBS 118893) TaxID=535722 RepID=E4UXJ6_ARTGP|nr:folylpolyglutamate synthase [Nannizzia gypsea CBS 118893]EFR02730.1 folylpolyglutamate synthase [Nannizzia gypsea CBS 118893]
MERYEEAVRCLNSRRARAKSNLDDMRGSDDMVKWLKLLGHSVEDLNRLNAIHIAGTKGKGSTCAFVASFLKEHRNNTGYPRKIGLYTSPHIGNIRERICINNEPISQELFTFRFFEIWDKLPSEVTDTLDIPRYLQLLALLSFHVFIKEGVDVAIYETHLGGEFDATNIISAPTVTAITSISIDHRNLLGPTIEDIAWHKAGIFKPGSVALSTLQEQAVATVLQQRAAEKGVALKFIGLDSDIPASAVALKPKVQRFNCSLALAVLRAWLSATLPLEQSCVDNDIVSGIENFYWPGRYQQINDQNYQWFLDGAHTESSLCYAVEWFAERARELQDILPPTRILVFSHFSHRDGIALLRSIAKSLLDKDIQVQHVIISSYDEMRDGPPRIDRNLTKRFSQEKQESYAEFWRTFDPTATVSCERTIEETLHRARRIGDLSDGMQALVTGSLHLVSGLLYLLETDHLISHPPMRAQTRLEQKKLDDIRAGCS